MKTARFFLGSALALAIANAGCASHSENLAPIRSALDQGDFKTAIAKLNEELEAKDATEVPRDLGGDKALLLLDRATIQQSLVQWKASKTDYQAADKAIDLLDLSSNAADTIAEYMFSGSSKRYQAPPYEKLGVNTLNMINYLETNDLGGGRVEARRLGVYTDFYRNKLKEESTMLGIGGLLGGFILEKNGDYDGALHYYDDALVSGSFPALTASVRGALPFGSYKSKRLTKAAEEGPLPPLDQTGEGEVLVVVGYGRVPIKIANRLPIGVALTFASPFLSPTNITQANELAAQGLVTWVNFPSLGKEQGGLEGPRLTIDDRAQTLDAAVNVTAQVEAEWKKIEGGIMAAAIIRMITRAAVGIGATEAGRASGSNEGRVAGFIAGLIAQATLSALDKPDTRSWETLPARIAVARIRLPAGAHTVSVSTRGMTRTQPVTINKGGWAIVSLLAIR